jgi:hypothetical protein
MLELNEYTDYQCKVVAGHAFKALTKGNLIPPFMCHRERKMAKNYALNLRDAGLIPEMFSRIVEGKV